MHRSTAFVRRACAVGTATALVGLTTGFGVMTATTAYAAEGTAADSVATAPAVPGSAATAPVTPGLPTDAGTPAPTATTAATPAPTATGTPATVTPSATPTAPAPATTTTSTSAKPTDVKAAAAAGVTIAGETKVGSTLVARTSGFTKPTSFSYLWSVGGVDTTVDDGSYVIQPGDVAKTITVTVTNTLRDGSTEQATTTSAVVTEDPVFVGADGKPVTTGTNPDDDALGLTATAGADFSYTFHATGSPKPTFSLAWSYPDDRDGDDPDATPADQLPEGIVFDAATGTVSGSTDEAAYYSFAVTATSGPGSVTEYVDLDVEAAAPFGVQVFSMDKADFDRYISGDASGTFTSWIIDTDGSVSTDVETISQDGDGGFSTDVVTPGGRVTVKQGGTLIVNGGLVDRFGNQITDADGNGAPIAVTSDTASDVIAPDPDFGDFVSGFYNVTFPHASTHRLTVSSADFATAFAVEVVPTAVTPPAAVPPIVAPAAQPIGTAPVRVVPRATAGRLAYTGTDTTDVLPWALGMLAAGAALVGLRTARRRRAQR